MSTIPAWAAKAEDGAGSAEENGTKPQETNKEKKHGDTGSSSPRLRVSLRISLRLYAFALSFFRVTGLNCHTTRRFSLYAFFSFFDILA